MKITKNKKAIKRNRRHARIRARVSGTKDVPRLSVFRSNKFIYAQLINDKDGKILCAANDMKITKGTKTEKAQEVGKAIAESAKEKKIKKVVFDRGGFLFTGRVKSLAEGARSNGLEF